jgi:hypothetical protein
MNWALALVGVLAIVVVFGSTWEWLARRANRKPGRKHYDAQPPA